MPAGATRTNMIVVHGKKIRPSTGHSHQRLPPPMKSVNADCQRAGWANHQMAPKKRGPRKTRVRNAQHIE
jgi:hypothetical protein